VQKNFFRPPTAETFRFAPFRFAPFRFAPPFLRELRPVLVKYLEDIGDPNPETPKGGSKKNFFAPAVRRGEERSQDNTEQYSFMTNIKRYPKSGHKGILLSFHIELRNIKNKIISHIK